MKSIFFYSAILIAFSISVRAQEFKVADARDIALFPQQNDFRNTLNLSGIWRFKKDSSGVGEKEKWFDGLKDYRSIAVPGSWNEQFDDMRDYLDVHGMKPKPMYRATGRGNKFSSGLALQIMRQRFGSTVYHSEYMKVEQKGKALQGKIMVTGNNQSIEVPVRFSGGVSTATVKIPNVRLWYLEDPFLYAVTVILNQGNKIVDRYITETGIRTIAATDKQILLNGRQSVSNTSTN